MRLAELVDVPVSVGRYGHAGGDVATVPVLSYLIEGSEIGPVLFDLGCAPPAHAAASGRPVVRDHRTIGEALVEAGRDPATVRTVVVSHLHWDHCVGLADLPNARMLVQREEIRFAFAPDPEQWRPYDAWENGRDPVWTEVLDRIDPLDGTVRLADGLTVLPTPGHTPGSQSLLVSSAPQPFLLCGDLMTSYENWRGIAGRPDGRGSRVPPGIHHDLQAWRTSMDRLELSSWVPLPAHDPRVFEVLAGRWDPRQS